MYALFAYIDGQWGIAGIDPHEECAVLFIDQIDNQFGEGTAFVAKLPDKADASDHHSAANNLKEMLNALESGSFDLDGALKNLNK